MREGVLRLTAVGLVCGLLGSGLAPSLAASGDEDAPKKGTEHAFDEYVEVNVSEIPASNTVATKLPTSTRLTPANVGTVPKLLFDEQDAVDLGDALRNVSGLNVQAGPAVHDFFIRGFDSLSSGLVLTDGAAEPEATFYSTYNVEAVEVLKGPAGFLYGTSPLAGVVNVVRKQPMPGDFGTFRGSAGSYGTFEGALDWNLATDDAARRFRVNALWNESDGYRDGRDWSRAAINPSFSARVGESGRLNLDFEYVDAEARPDGGIPVYGPPGALVLPDVPRRRSYQTPFDFSEQEIYRFQLNYEAELGERVTLRNKLYYRSLEWDSAGTLFTATPAPFAVRTFTTLDDEQEFVGNQLEAVLRFDQGAVRHDVLVGFEVARQADEFALGFVPPEGTPGFPYGIPALDLFAPVETLAAAPAPFPRDAGDARSVIFAPYVIDKIEFSDKLQLLLGARFDDLDVEDDLDGQERDDSELSPTVGVVYEPTAVWSVYANAGRSHAPASLRVSGNLEPERSTQFELGAKRRFVDGRLQATIAVYSIEREEIAVTDSGAITQQPGDQESRGLELELAAEPAPRLRTFFSYAYNDSELTRFVPNEPPGSPFFVDYSGNRPAYAPEHLANVWISKSFAGGLGVAGGVRYVSEQFIDAANTYEIDDYLLLDAAAFYDLDFWRFQLNVKNLTDEDYETGSYLSSSAVPGDPITVYGSVELRF